MADSSLFLFDPDASPPEAAPMLGRLAAEDAAVRRIALLDLADLEDDALLAPICSVLASDPAASVRAEAARVLGAWERDDIVDALCVALADADNAVRDAAAESLAGLKSADLAPVLVRHLGHAAHAAPFVAQAVLRALRELRDESAFEPALRALDSTDAGVRLEAVGVLGWLKDARALIPLTRTATHDADADVRRAAVGALGQGGHSEPADEAAIRDALLQALRDDAWQVREESATTLGKLRAQVALDALLGALDDPYWQVRLQAARALGKLADRRAGGALAGLLTHAISNLRKEAALALGELRDPAVLPALHDAAGDPDPEVRKAVRIAFAQIGTQAA
ncbi:HEAT repeat domain-containing protein [Paraburkholderia phosphatilytica]|uniref:HEAT repeat domain-containing protein n=1 Tax=Paraburkholderia phosphatilytica TaxID=2282883 RepID=UPI000E4AAB5E|nr:HEAT repeat domain-containing protein [Paraburkholderia phosphatilytica]